MAYADLLLGLRALFLESPEAPSREALLDARAPGLSPAERAALAGLPEDRLALYAGLLRENQALMVGFVAPCTLEVAGALAGVPREELARATLLGSPRTSSSLRELGARLVEHLEGRGAAWVERCPPLLDLARLERGQTEVFYAPDDEGGLTPHEFGERATLATVEEVLALEVRRASATRSVEVVHDVVAWRADRFEHGAWGPPPPRLPSPVGVLLSRDPGDLQTVAQVLDPAVHGLLLSDRLRDWSPLESLAEGWIAAAGVLPEDPAAAGRFFEEVAGWVRAGVLAVRPPAGTTPGG